MEIKITVEVKDQVEAYQLVNKINLKNEVKEVVIDKKSYKFDEDKKVKDLFKND